MDEFAQELREVILERMPDIEDIQIKRVLKNNSVAKLGMLFEDKRSNVSPTIYLEEFYEAYRGGIGLSTIADKVIACYEQDSFKCTDTTNTFTVKVSYCNLGGQFCRERMLRFNRNKLEVLGEEELISACLRRRDKKYVRAREI